MRLLITVQSMTQPVTGSGAYKALSFREQLEIVSKKLFYPSKSEIVERSISGLSWQLNLPPLPPPEVADLPVSILKNYWAGYSCRFKEKWYFVDFRGMTPLDDFGIEHKRIVNIWSFNFPMLSLEPSMYYVFSYLLKMFKNSLRPGLLLLAGKVYSYLHLKLKDLCVFELFKKYDGGGDPFRLIMDSMDEYKKIRTLTSLNFMFPIIEACHEVTWFENRELVLHEEFRKKGSRWYIPLIPAGLFTVVNFRISNWQFLR